MNIEDYKYKYEMHLHTSESSRCGANTASEMVIAHKNAGYAGIVVTDHAWGGNTKIDIHLPYRVWVKEFSRGYYNALEEGDRQEIDVFFGWEAGYDGTEFLIYGLSPEWLMENERLWDATVEEQYKIVHDAGGIVSHAHPFREEPYIPKVRLFPEYVDAVEIGNATHSNPLSKHHNNPEWDDMANNYAKTYNKGVTAGSDVHSVETLGGGILFKSRKDYQSLCSAVVSKDDYILCNGRHYMDVTGNYIGNYEK